MQIEICGSVYFELLIENLKRDTQATIHCRIPGASCVCLNREVVIYTKFDNNQKSKNYEELFYLHSKSIFRHKYITCFCLVSINVKSNFHSGQFVLVSVINISSFLAFIY